MDGQKADDRVGVQPEIRGDEASAALQGRRDAVLEAALPEVPFEGWTRTALLRGAESAGLAPEEAMAAFPDGMGQVLAHFSGWADRRMLEALAGQDLAAMKVRARITLAVRARLELLSPHREAVRRSLALLALPQHAGLAPRLVYDTVDAIWLAAGDRSTDFNFYTKRLLLAGVLGSTLLYWLQDNSPGTSDTWSFLDRRIAEVLRIGQGLGQGFGRLAGGIGAGLPDFLPSPSRFVRLVRDRLRPEPPSRP